MTELYGTCSYKTTNPDRVWVWDATNRQQAMQAKKKKFWCYRCDHGYMGQWGKCPYCGKKNNSKKKR